MNVTCLCLTRNRWNWLSQAVECFEAQTYKDSKLLILDNSDEPMLSKITLPGRASYKFIPPPRPNIGGLRNIGCGLIDTDLIAHWDDDDWYSPLRLEEQVALIESTGKDVTGYSSIKFTDGADWWKYMGTPSFAIGVTLMYKKSWWAQHPFHEVNIGEDNQFAMEAWALGQLYTFDGAPDLLPERTAADRIIASIHPGNTSEKQVNNSTYLNLKNVVWDRVPVTPSAPVYAQVPRRV